MNNKQRFAIRKYTVGTASVLVGVMFLMSTPDAQASEQNTPSVAEKGNVSTIEEDKETEAPTLVAEETADVQDVEVATEQVEETPVLESKEEASGDETTIEAKKDNEVPVDTKASEAKTTETPAPTSPDLEQSTPAETHINNETLSPVKEDSQTPLVNQQPATPIEAPAVNNQAVITAKGAETVESKTTTENMPVPTQQSGANQEAPKAVTTRTATTNTTTKPVKRAFRNVSSENVEGQSVDENDYRFLIVGNTATITDYLGTDKVLTIPNTVQGKKVTEIKNDVFRNKDLTSITLQEGLVKIGNHAFAENKLTNVTIPKSVKLIGEHVFRDNQLSSVTLQEGLTSIGAHSFSKNQLTSITIPETVTTIDDTAFGYNKLTSVTIPTGVKVIGDTAFGYNEITSVSIPEGVTKIGNHVFRDNKLASVTIPQTVTQIGNSAFQNNQLTTIDIPKGVTSLGNSAFQNNKLTELVIPEGVTTLGAQVFAYNKIANVTIPSTVTKMGDAAFRSNELTSVTIPEGITEIGKETFRNNKLTEVVIPKNVTTIGESAFQNNQLINVTIPEGVTSLGKSSFENNLLTTIDIPESVTSIGERAFAHNRFTHYHLPKHLETSLTEEQKAKIYEENFIPQYRAAEEGIKKAEDEAKAAQATLEAVTKDGIVTAEDKAAVDAANAKIEAAKAAALELLKVVPEGTEGQAALQERLNKVNLVASPDVNDKPNVDDSADKLKLADDLVKAAEKAEKDAEAKLAEVTRDGVVTPADKAAVDAANAKIEAAKTAAQTALDDVPAGIEGKVGLQERLDNVNPVASPEVNDKDANGISDENDAKLKLADDLVKAAEKAEKDAEDKLAEVTRDGLVTPAEKAAVDAANAKIEAAKKAAQTALDDVPAGIEGKVELQERLDNVNPVASPEVNDADANGISDENDAKLKLADDLVKAAEKAEKDAEDKLAEVMKDGLVTPAEKAAVDAANAKIEAAKTAAQTALDDVPAGVEGKVGLQTRLDNVNPVVSPDVNDANANGTSDENDAKLKLADDLVKAAEKAEKDTEAKLAEVTRDGVVTPADKAAVDAANAKIEAAKTAAQTALDDVPAGVEGKVGLQTRLDNVNPVVSPEVNDADANGISDENDAKLKLADDLVKAAEKAEKEAEDKLAEVTRDGVVTPADKAAVDAANAKIEAAKTAAQTALDDVPAGVEGKVELQERLDNVNPVVSPEVNDANANGISDDNDAKLKLADDLVKAAEKAEKDAEDKLAEVMKDGLVTPAEKAAVDAANAKIEAAKTAAQTALDDVPAGVEGKVGLQTRLDNVNPVASPEVNDADANGMSDDNDAKLKLADDLVKAAEKAGKEAEDKLAEIMKDGLVTPAEKAAVDAANAKIEAAKTAAQTALDDVPAGIEGKVGLQERLDNVNPVASPDVNDANANGISDDNDAKLKLADDLVKAAEKAEKEAEDKLAEVMKDGLVTPAEKAAVDAANAKIEAAKTAAQTALDDIPAGIEGKVKLQERLDNVNPVVSPDVNDADANGISDENDAKLKLADDLVKAAEKAEKEAEDKLAEVMKDGLVTPAEKALIEELNAKVDKAKKAAQTALDDIPAGVEGKVELQERLDKVHGVAVPEVNDANSNGIHDDVEASLQGGSVGNKREVVGSNNGGVASTQQNATMAATQDQNTATDSNQVSTKTLPETGNTSTSTTLFGSLFAALGGLFLFGRRRKEKDAK